ncbi:sulfurtransferase [Nocardioides mesophilus]|uniref:Sulfurtransferase n=1 Tax=Nocardioides mesophilus TaxID=433659 RepID=A0A7G9RBL9_9ACTN|nr:sulfurtransferase [Nocardioides mesophilus]QNN52994.1 sulfurtransferase [Nocardioides mesophilus]
MSALISAEELAERLGEVSVLDVRYTLGRSDGHDQFLAGHVPGAAYVDLDADLSDPVGDGSRGRHPLPDPERFAAAMRRAGVRRDRTVVVHDAVGGTSAARAWWLLRDHGHPDVRLLDGGWQWWDRDGRPVETGPADVAPGDFGADPGHLPVLGPEQAARLAADGVLIDARAGERFRGETEPLDPVAGHIPGAVNVPTKANLRPDDDPAAARFRSPQELRTAYAAVGVQPGTAVGSYCGSGVTATHDLFALHLIGIEGALFAGSWSAWVSDPTRPVATGE